jgi:hypothetical protein
MKSMQLLAAIATGTLLSACATHSHKLVTQESPGFLRGEFTHADERRLVLESATRRYEASGFEVRRDSNLAELQRRYRGSDPKHWERIFAGHDKDHETHSADVAAVARDGSRLDCRLVWTAGVAPAGHCRDATGRELPVRFE